MNITQATRTVLEANADRLASAGTSQAIGDLLPKITEEIEQAYKPHSDKFTYRAVVIILGSVVLVVAITYAWYTLTPTGTGLRDLPDALIALGSAAVGALAGLLAPAPRD